MAALVAQEAGEVVVVDVSALSYDDGARLLCDTAVVSLCALCEDEVVGVVDGDAPDAAVTLWRVGPACDALLPAHG